MDISPTEQFQSTRVRFDQAEKRKQHLAQRLRKQADLLEDPDEHRLVLSEWRALILLRRATRTISPAARRWSNLPRDFDDLYPVFRKMLERDEITPIEGLRHFYQVTAPNARTAPLEAEEVVLEAHPYAALSHISALVFHGLTTERPAELTVIVSPDGTEAQLPLGTEPRD